MIEKPSVVEKCGEPEFNVKHLSGVPAQVANVTRRDNINLSLTLLLYYADTHQNLHNGKI